MATKKKSPAFTPEWIFGKISDLRESGVQEFRSSGVQEFRSSGVQVFRCSGVQVFRSSGVQVFRCSGVQEFRCSGVQVFRCSGVRVFGCSGAKYMAPGISMCLASLLRFLVHRLISGRHTAVGDLADIQDASAEHTEIRT